MKAHVCMYIYVCHFSFVLVILCQLWVFTDVSVTGEFWLGLRKIHSLAAQGNSVLHILLEDWKQGRRFMEYRFHLDGPESNYTIHLTHLSGDFPDPMGNHTGMMFSTKDRDNDNHQDFNCAHNYTGTADVFSECYANKGIDEYLSSSISCITCNFCYLPGGWWFNACGDANLNGRYFQMRPKGRSERRRGIQWRPIRKANYSLKFTQISVHPVAPPSSTSASSETGVFLWSGSNIPPVKILKTIQH